MRIALVLFLAASLAAQDPRFDVQTHLVVIPAAVADAKGHAIEGLEPPDFVVLDNGRPQKASVNSPATGVAPIALVVAVQSSGISAAVLDKVQKVGAMIQPLITGERGCAALVSFAERVDWLQDCTNDPDALTSAFHKLQTGEQKKGRMLDAVDQAVERLGKLSNVRRVLLLISESRDRGSETNLETVAVDAQKAGVTVYAATYSAFGTGFTAKSSEYSPPPPPPSGPRFPNQEPETLPDRDTVPISPPARRVDLIGAIGEFSRIGKVKATEVLATATGGTQFPFTRQKGLEDAIEKLGSELESQYVLSFAPETRAPGFHHVEVRLSREGKYRVRARPGYWSVQVSR